MHFATVCTEKSEMWNECSKERKQDMSYLHISPHNIRDADTCIQTYWCTNVFHVVMQLIWFSSEWVYMLLCSLCISLQGSVKFYDRTTSVRFMWLLNTCSGWNVVKQRKVFLRNVATCYCALEKWVEKWTCEWIWSNEVQHQHGLGFLVARTSMHDTVVCVTLLSWA